MQLFVVYEGYDEIVSAPKEIRIDFTMNADLYGKIEKKGIIKSYSDLKKETAILQVMTLNTIFANKIGLLADRTRNGPRDIYNIWFLFQRTAEFPYDLEEIKKRRKGKYSVNLTGNSLLRDLNNRTSIQENWKVRLEKQIPELPSYTDVVIKIKRYFKAEFAEEFSED